MSQKGKDYNSVRYHSVLTTNDLKKLILRDNKNMEKHKRDLLQKLNKSKDFIDSKQAKEFLESIEDLQNRHEILYWT